MSLTLYDNFENATEQTGKKVWHVNFSKDRVKFRLGQFNYYGEIAPQLAALIEGFDDGKPWPYSKAESPPLWVRLVAKVPVKKVACGIARKRRKDAGKPRRPNRPATQRHILSATRVRGIPKVERIALEKRARERLANA